MNVRFMNYGWSPGYTIPRHREAEAREDQECNSNAGKKCGINWRGDRDAPDKKGEAYHGDCH